MERKPPSSLDDFVAVLKRRKYWIVIPFVIFAGLGIALTPLVPRTYQSTTTILVVPQKVPTIYVKPTTSDVVNKLTRIGLEVMSGTGFLQIIDSLDLYPDLRKKANPSQAIAAMRKDIAVNLAPDSTDGRGGVGAFTISYIGPTPKKAQQATKEIADLFIVENAKEGHRLARGTDAFLTAQVNQAGQQLAAQQAKIQAFRSSHLGSLPEQTQANLGMVSQYQAELQANGAAIGQDNQQRVYLQSVLNVNPNSTSGETNAPAAPTPLQIELAEKQTELNADLLKYTPQHPDIVRLQHDIAALEFQVRHAPKTTAANVLVPLTPVTGPSVNDQLRAQLVALNTDLQARNARQKQIEQKILQLQGSVSTLPAVQTAFASLDSDYLEMQKNYNALLEKQQEASMAAALDEGNGSEQFMVLNQANLPVVPYRPNPILLYMGAVFIGLFIGFLCALVIELRDDTLHDADEVAAYLKLPVMIALPKCPPFSGEPWLAGTSKK
jgi:polysaccharide chain length determinant protein (PEP-CTERM system associated)